MICTFSTGVNMMFDFIGPSGTGRSRIEDRPFYLEVYRQMLAVAYAKMKNQTDALDIVQESWLKILLNYEKLKDPDKFIQWAKAIAANTANNAIRRKVLYNDILREHAQQIRTALVRENTVEAHVENKEIMEKVRGLDELTRKTLIYKYYYNFKDKEIAEAFDCPVGTVKARIHRGKERLRKMLETP